MQKSELQVRRSFTVACACLSAAVPPPLWRRWVKERRSAVRGKVACVVDLLGM